MSVWLILTPLIAWLVFGPIGYRLLTAPIAKLWTGTQITTRKAPFDPSRPQHRAFAFQIRVMGFLAILAPGFLSLMALLVAVGVVSPAKN